MINPFPWATARQLIYPIDIQSIWTPRSPITPSSALTRPVYMQIPVFKEFPQKCSLHGPLTMINPFPWATARQLIYPIDIQSIWTPLSPITPSSALTRPVYTQIPVFKKSLKTAGRYSISWKGYSDPISVFLKTGMVYRPTFDWGKHCIKGKAML